MQRPRGTRDFLPPEMLARRDLENRLRNLAESYGFGEISTPTFEEEDLFVIRSGPDILEELYSFEDKGGRSIALRPELTAPAMRLYVNELQFSPKPIKMYYFANAFRYERPQSGRYREFWQFGTETIGAEGVLATAESMALAYAMVCEAGVLEPVMRIGHIGVMRGILEDEKIPVEHHHPLLHMIDKGDMKEAHELFESMGKGDVGDIISSLIGLQDDREGAEKMLKEHPRSREFVAALHTSKEMLCWMGVEDVRIDLGVVRGLDYYTGIVFEIDAPNLGAEKQVCGGGEYRLAHLFGGTDVATVGFAMGFDRLLLAGECDKPEQSLDYYVIPVSADILGHAVKLVTRLRSMGHSADMDLLGRNLKKSMKYAASQNAKKAVIVGPRDIEEGACTVHDMATGEDVKTPLGSVGMQH